MRKIKKEQRNFFQIHTHRKMINTIRRKDMINKAERALISNFMVDAFEDFLMYMRNVNFDKLDADIGITIKQINTVCTQYSQALLHLILEDFLWETEGLLRTVMEGSIKLAYIACEPDQIENKIFEFSQILPYINGTKRNKRIENILNITDLSERSRDADIYKKILDCELPDIDENINRKNRNEIKRKWDFIAMIEAIQNSGIKELVNTTVLSYPYGMMSNIVHMDYDGLNYIFERYDCSEDERDKVNSLQTCRQYSDIYGLTLARTISICLIYQTDYTELLKLPSKHQELLERIENQKKLHL